MNIWAYTIVKNDIRTKKMFIWREILKATKVYNIVDRDPRGTSQWGEFDIPGVAKLREVQAEDMRIILDDPQDLSLVEQLLGLAVGEYFRCTATVEVKLKGSNFNQINVTLYHPYFKQEFSLFFRVQDITAFEGDAIVNSTDRHLSGAGGVDAAIHKAAGMRLREECRHATLNPGEVLMTRGYDLPAKYVIHTVAPNRDNGKNKLCEYELYQCYSRPVKLAQINGCKSIAYPSIGTGYHGLPPKTAAMIAIQALRHSCTIPVTMCFSSQETLDLYVRTFATQLLEELRQFFVPWNADLLQYGVEQHGETVPFSSTPECKTIFNNIMLLNGLDTLEEKDYDKYYLWNSWHLSTSPQHTDWFAYAGEQSDTVNFTGCQLFLYKLLRCWSSDSPVLEHWRSGNILRMVNRALKLVPVTSFTCHGEHFYPIK